jgi:Tol biopolymer transport system component
VIRSHALIALTVLLQVASAPHVAQQGEKPLQGKIFFFGPSNGQLIQKMNPDGTQLETLLRLDGSVHSGRVSPDGRRLAFGFQPRGSSQFEVWILEPGGVPRKLADRGSVTAWSPDGTKIACYSGSERGDWECFTIDAATGGVRPLLIPKGDVVEDWSPDGETLCVVAGNLQRTFEHATKGKYPLRQVYLMKLDGTQQRLLTPETSFDTIWPRFSPDSTRIAHYRREYPNRVGSPIESLVTRKPDGSGAKTIFSFTKLSDDQVSVRPLGSPAWSPDGRSLVWVADRRRRDRRRLSSGKWIEFELVFVLVGDGSIRRLPLEPNGISGWGTIDWR